MKITLDNIDKLAWGKMDNSIPAVVQDARSGQVLMLGYMDAAATEKTIKTGLVTFFSRSKQRLWTKGETSGNTLNLVDISTDCDQDALLVLADPQGPTCHLGTESCFAASDKTSFGFVASLENVLQERKHADPDSSYTAKLYQKGIKRIAQKVGEEGVETALAATVKDIDELKNESADLIYHLIVLLSASDLSLQDAISVLKQRHEQN
ncbi:MAG: bifunctional phosphoribosyl-AMP cyclohydrolase/phosphoribosyl-ATP diphosphatase HisIE [Pseudomonadota bacterium]